MRGTGKPVVGITPAATDDVLVHGTFRRQAIGAAYVAAVLAAGGVPLVLPYQAGHAADLLAVVDGLLLSGGGDVDPARYGDTTRHPATYGIDAARDAFELDLATAAVAAEVPVLGICRGLQVLNVAGGGTLWQHVPDLPDGEAAVGHRQQERGLAADAVGHELRLEPGSLAARAHDGAATIGVNSFHHQAVRDLAPGFVATAHAPDGVVEAVERPGRAWLLGVQWHPELMFERDLAHLAPFAALVDAAAARMAAAVG